MSNVHHLPRYTRKVNCAEDAMTILRTAMHDMHPDDLSTKVGVSASCIRSIRSGRTKWPRHATFFGLIEVLGLHMYLMKKEL